MLEEPLKRHRKWGVHQILNFRNEEGEFDTLYNKLRRYPDKFIFMKYYRMLPDSFDKLYELIKHDCRLEVVITDGRSI